MTDFGNPAGSDIATVLTGSGLTLLLSAGIVRYGDQFRFSQAELYGIGGATLVGLGVAFGLLLLLRGSVRGSWSHRNSQHSRRMAY